MKPSHVAIIMDGNGRWAEHRESPRGAGHKEGAEAVRRIVRHARSLDLDCLTLFAFSSLNWGRPTDEINDLMDLLLEFLFSERQELLENGIRLRAIGERDFLPSSVRAALTQVESDTAACDEMELVLAVSYDGRRDMVRAARRLAQMAKNGEILPADLTETQLMAALSTGSLPDVDLLIRTSGELRTSGFLPLEACYAELYFVETLWPDFAEEHLNAAIAEYERRQRRFGLTSDQLAANG
jgi:undecaprenyl diphosphate synthase